VKIWVPVVRFKELEIAGKSKPYNMPVPGSPARVKKSRAKPIGIMLAVVLALAAAISMSIKGLSSPAEGTISQSPLSSSPISDPTATVAGNYSGKYISLSYPANYKPVPSKLSGNFLEVASFYGTKDRSKQISVGILRENIGDDSGIAYRRQHKELYRQENSTGNTVTFSSIDGHEWTSYLAHSGLVASVSVSSSNITDLSADSQAVVSSLRWN
jgi:hypothetical protein